MSVKQTEEERDALKRTDVELIDKCINDELSVERFLTDNEYPCYDQVVQLIGNNLAMFSEYGEFNHNMMNNIWNDIHNTDKLKSRWETHKRQGWIHSND